MRDLSDDQTALVDMARAFAADRIAPHALAWEDSGIPRAFLEEAGALGFGGLYVPEDQGGAGMTRHDATLIFEALAEACPSTSAFLSIHNMCAWMIATWGSEAQRAALPEILACRTVASYCLTEPGSGSDAAALRTRAVRDAEGWRVSGTKAFISGGDFSDLYLVMVRTGADGPRGISAMLIPAGTPGLSFGAQERKMGWKGQPTAQVILEDARLPDTALLGEAGAGFGYAMKGLDGGRLNIAACSLGGAQAALDAALRYSQEREAFGAPIAKLQAIQFKLADMETELQAARLMLRRAARALDAGAPDATRWCAMAKRFVTDTAFRVADDALQIHGGYGYLADYGIEKIVRDLRVHRILEGTNEIMRVIVARSLVSE